MTCQGPKGRIGGRPEVRIHVLVQTRNYQVHSPVFLVHAQGSFFASALAWETVVWSGANTEPPYHWAQPNRPGSVAQLPFHGANHECRVTTMHLLCRYGKVIWI